MEKLSFPEMCKSSIACDAHKKTLKNNHQIYTI